MFELANDGCTWQSYRCTRVYSFYILTEITVNYFAFSATDTFNNLRYSCKCISMQYSFESDQFTVPILLQGELQLLQPKWDHFWPAHRSRFTLKVLKDSIQLYI